jgi:hypothetical protein
MIDSRGRAPMRAAAPLVLGLVVVALAACSAAPTSAPIVAPTIAPTSTATVIPTESAAPATDLPTATPTASGAAACAATDLKASHGLVEGAAGSRLTTVVLVALHRCTVDLYPVLGLRDAKGASLVGSVAGGSGRIDLNPDASYESQVRFGNWCNPDPAFPLKLVVGIRGEEITVTGSSFPDEGDMPPCSGAGGPVLEAGAWEATP